jgi:hypothetical protein
MKRACMLMAFGALAAGCGDGRGGDDDDGGTIITLMDGGGDDRDGGTTPRRDSGGGGTEECEMNLPPWPAAEAGVRCSAETRTCMNACTSGACIQECLDDDMTTPLMQGTLVIDCSLCINYNIEVCLEQNGSATQLHAFRCCVEESGCTNQTCVQTMCGSQITALQSSPGFAGCAGTPPTGAAFAACYPPAS